MQFRNHAALPHFSRGPRAPTFLKPGLKSTQKSRLTLPTNPGTGGKCAKINSSVWYAMSTGQVVCPALFFSPCHYLINNARSLGSPTACGDCSIWFAIIEREGMNRFISHGITALSATHLSLQSPNEISRN